jgi:hypothetical protein
MVRGPEPVGGFVEMVRAVGFGVAFAVARAVACVDADADAVGVAKGVGDVPRGPLPDGVGIACPEGSLQALTTTKAHTSAVHSRRLGAARTWNTVVAWSGQAPQS